MRAARLNKELVMLEKSPPPGASCWQVGDSKEKLEAAIMGPEGSPYQGGLFKLEVSIPERYPLEPPQMRFTTPVYHPNIDEGGRICLDILKPAPHGSWKPSINLSSVLTSLQVLLAEPNPEDPLVPEIANIFRDKREEFQEKAKMMTKKHAGKGGKEEAKTKRVCEDDRGGEKKMKA